MRNASGLQVSTPSDREIVMTRDFGATRDLVFDCITKPELIRRWLLGPPGWTMDVCEVDARVGGRFRYLWRDATANVRMGMGGLFSEVTAPERLVHSERFDESWYDGEGQVTTTLVERNGTTTLTLRLEYESREARDQVLKSPMEQGLGANYDRLASVLATLGS